jgi:hypothetical protein
MYVYDNYQNRGIKPSAWGNGLGTLRIHRINGEIQKYCYDPAEIDYWCDWWEPVAKASTKEEKEEIISHFKQIQEAERNANKKAPLPLFTLEKLINSTLYTEKRN